MKKVAVVFNGGTISMKVDERIKAAVPSLSGEEIMAMVTGIEDYAEIINYNFSSLPSPHVSPEIMLELSKFVQELADREDISGIVITHGTDSLEETAYFLDLTVKTEKPVVVTEVTKANSMALNAFRTPNFGPVGIVDNNQVIFYRKGKKGEKLSPKNMDKDVALIKCVSGMDSSFIDFALEKGFKGIVIEGMGRGNVPPTVVPGIKRAIEKNIPVVLVSRCFEGRVFESYGYEGGGKHLMNLGVIFGDTMPGQKARIELLVAINSGKTIDEIRGLFEEGLYEHN